MLRKGPIRKLLLAALVTCSFMLVPSESARAQGWKKTNPVKSSGKTKKSPIFKIPFWKKNAEKNAPAKEARPTPKLRSVGSTKIEDTEELPDTAASVVEVDSDVQWSPDGRDLGQSVPSSGPLGLTDLIQLAVRNSEDIIAAKEDIGIAELRRQAERDWDDPQIRFSVSRDNDVELQRPYKTTETRYRDSKGRDVTDSVERNNIRGNTSRERRIRNDRELTKEKITQRVTPGVDGDRVDETVESRSNQSRDEARRGTSRDRGGNTASNNDSGSERTRSRTTERTRSFESNFNDPTHPDSGFRIRVRFPIPNFLERKQRLRQAASEISLARVELDALQRAVVRDVRNAYERIEYLQALNSFDRQLLSHAEDFMASLVAQDRENKKALELQATVPGLKNLVSRVRPDELADARREIFSLQSELIKNQRDIRDEKFALAELAGIGDPDRITFTNSLVELDVDFGKMDIGYLKAMAMLKRPELKKLRHRLEIAESETAEERAKRIPMIDFFDIDYGQSFEFGERSSDEFGAQIGMSLPLASLFKNKTGALRQREVDAFTRRIKAITNKIGNEVQLAVIFVRSAREDLLQAQETVVRAEAMLKTNTDAISASAEDSDRLAESRYDDQEVISRAKQEVVRALRNYNQGVRALEKTIGADLETALGKQVR